MLPWSSMRNRRRASSYARRAWWLGVSASVLAHLVAVGIFLTVGRGVLAPLRDLPDDAFDGLS
jgi:hypothetical protein